MKISFVISVACLALVASGNKGNVFWDDLTVPEGFSIDVIADIPFARSLDINRETGTVFVSSFDFTGIQGHTKANHVWAIPSESYGCPLKISDDAIVAPNGIAFDAKRGDLYVASIDALYKFPNVEDNLGTPVNPETVISTESGIMPNDPWHGWRYIRIVEDTLYMAIGAPCNVPGNDRDDCLTGDVKFGTIQSLDLTSTDTPSFTMVAEGVRNSVGMTWAHDMLYFTENGRDNMEGYQDTPPDEVNRVDPAALSTHFGFPYCYGKDIPDPDFPIDPNTTTCLDDDVFVPALWNNGPHVANLGLRFYYPPEGAEHPLPDEYIGQLLVARHGSWNRDNPIGYDVIMVPMDDQGVPTSDDHSDFFSGFLPPNDFECVVDDDCPGEAKCQNADTYTAPFSCRGWGRPADVEIANDGSVLVTDELNGVVFQISYNKPCPVEPYGCPADSAFPWMAAAIGVFSFVAIGLGIMAYARRPQTGAGAVADGAGEYTPLAEEK